MYSEGRCKIDPGMFNAGKAPILAVPREQREAIESAIMEAFLAGTDENFDVLLEVCELLIHLSSCMMRAGSISFSFVKLCAFHFCGPKRSALQNTFTVCSLSAVSC